MSLSSLVNFITVVVGVPSIIVALVYIGRKVQILNDMRETINKVKNNIKIVADFLTKNFSAFNSSELHTYSPLGLTEEGKAFIEDIGFSNVFTAHREDFIGFIDSEEPEVKYDVENAAIKSIHLLYEKPFMKFLKVYFYNNPARNIANTAPTLGVYIRDVYLNEHPEITQ